MKLKTLIIGLALLTSVSAQASTNSWYIQLFTDAKAFFSDGTNYFNTGSVQVEAGPIMNIGNGQFGFDIDTQFPVAQQASIGFDVLYFGGHAYDGTLNTTLGTTWIIPKLNQPVYTYTQIGVGTDLQDASKIINIEWVGAKTQWTIKTGLISANDTLKAGVNIAAGHVSGVTGTLARIMGMIEYDY